MNKYSGTFFPVTVGATGTEEELTDSELETGAALEETPELSATAFFWQPASSATLRSATATNGIFFINQSFLSLPEKITFDEEGVSKPARNKPRRTTKVFYPWQIPIEMALDKSIPSQNCTKKKRKTNQLICLISLRKKESSLWGGLFKRKARRNAFF